MVSQYDIHDKPLCLHINSKQLSTSDTLLFSSCSLDTIPEIAIIFSFFFKNILKSIIDLAIWLAVRSVLRLLVLKYYLLQIYVLYSRLEVVLHTAVFFSGERSNFNNTFMSIFFSLEDDHLIFSPHYPQYAWSIDLYQIQCFLHIDAKSIGQVCLFFFFKAKGYSVTI